MICKTCEGTGHDKNSKPIIEFIEYTDDKGKKRKRHVTKAQGSGCLTCLGRGAI